MFGMIEVTVRCRTAATRVLHEVARDIESDFQRYRPWYRHVRCRAVEGDLEIRAISDFDADGSALQAEFQTAVRERLPDAGEAEIVSVTEVEAHSNALNATVNTDAWRL